MGLCPQLLIRGVFAAVRARQQVVVASKKKEIMMWEALREAVDEEMERDPTVCVMGKLIPSTSSSTGQSQLVRPIL
jgi:hypothetical protein